MIVRVAEVASAKSIQQEVHPSVVQSCARTNLVQTGVVGADGILGLSDAERGVWGTGVATGWPVEKNGERAEAWDVGIRRKRAEKRNGAPGSGLDVHAPPFRMERL